MTYDQRETQYEIEQERDEEEHDPEAERLVSEIEETRSGMGATIDQIGHRLQPQTIADEAVGKIREATVGRVERMIDDAGQTAQRTGNNLMDTILQNPVPAALAGLGIGWLALRMRQQVSPNGGSRQYGNGYRYSSGYGYNGYQNGSSGSDRLQRARGVAEDVIGGAQTAMGDATGRAQEVGSDIQRAAQTAVGDTQQKVQQAQGQAQDVLRDAQGQFDRTLNENPLALGALAVGVGAAVALAIPETQKEREIYGEHRDKLVEQVSTVASQALDQAQTKVEEVATQVTEQVGEQDQSDS
jgi:ElaB/YqjD/DUF883 family membrane-anchored ribosome-binding protein